MADAAAGRHFEPVDAAVPDADAIDIQRFGDDDKILPVRAQSLLLRQPGDTREAAALFVHSAADLDRTIQFDAGAANCFGRVDRGRNSSLHVAGAASIDAAVLDDTAKRIQRPPFTGRHDIEVAVQMDGGTEGAAAAKADDIEARVHGGVLGPALGGVILDVEPTACETIADQPGAVFVNLAGWIDGRDFYQIRGKGDELVRGCVDGSKHAVDRGGRDHGARITANL